MAGPLSSPAQERPSTPTALRTPPNLSRESSVKRGRGASNSSVASIGLHNQNGVRSTSPWRTDAPNSARPSLDTNRQPSLVQGVHHRQISHSTRPAVPRSHTATASINPTQSRSPSRGVQNPINIQPGDQDERALGRVFSNSSQASMRSRREPAAVNGKPNFDNMNSALVQESNGNAAQNNHGRLQHKSMGESALDHLFQLFTTQANGKINQCAAQSLTQTEAHLEIDFGYGADPHFDQLLHAIGHTASKIPKPLVDKLVLWYRNASERVDSSFSRAAQLNGTAQNNRQTAHSATASSDSTNYPTMIPTRTAEAERRSSVALYLLCRALIEVLPQTSLTYLTRPESEKIQNLIYKQHFRPACRDPPEHSALRGAKWEILTHTLGVLFELDFDGMAYRILTDLRSFQKCLGIKGNPDKEGEAEACQFMRGLKNLRLQSQSETWSQSTSLVHTLAELFGNVHGQPAKEAYCRLLGAMLLPLAGRPGVDLERAQWRKNVVQIQERLNQLCSKPKYWPTVFPVQAIVACVSPFDLFLTKWHSILSSLPTRLRERNNRATALKATCRMLWIYLSRTMDTQETVTKTFQDLVHVVFFSGKKYSLSREPAIAETLIYLIRIIGFKDHDLCLRSIIFPLTQIDTVCNGQEGVLRVENIDPDKAVIGIRAFTATVNDLERNEEPPFPIRFDDERVEDGPAGVHSKSNRHRPTARKSGHNRDDKLAKLIKADALPTSTREYYYPRFCEALGRIATVCDQYCGGQAALNERFNSQTPKTPHTNTWSLNRQEDSSSGSEDRFAFFELLNVTVQTLPRCLPNSQSLNQLLTVLCSSTVHVDNRVALSARHAMKSIASQGYAQFVVDRFSGFILNYDNKFSAGSNGAMLGLAHIEHILKLYVELLRDWVGELQEKHTKNINTMPQAPKLLNRNMQFNMSSTWSQVDRVESQGLFFLCSSSSRVRQSAVNILKLVTQLDSALGQSYTRITHVMDSHAGPILCLKNNKSLNLSQRSRLERDLRKLETQNPLIDLCCSEQEDDVQLWYIMFPRLIEAIFSPCQVAVAQTREDVCARVAQMQGLVEVIDERQRTTQPPNSVDSNTRNHSRRQSAPSTELTVEQWKIYLLFACKTLTKFDSNASTNSQDSSHTRKSSKSSQNPKDWMSNATDLFGRVIPLLTASNALIRNAVVTGLGSVSLTLYKPLLECLESISRKSDDSRVASGSHYRTASSPRRTQGHDFVPEVAQVYKLTSHFLQEQSVYNDEWVMASLATYTREVSMFLRGVEGEWDYHRLRLHYCGLIEGFFIGVNKTQDPQRWMTFQTRRAVFSLMEEWSGFSLNTSHSRVKESPSTQINIETQPDARSVVLEMSDLRNAALSAMATLCAGPLSSRTGNTTQKFDVQRIMSWIHKMLTKSGDTTQEIGRRALRNVITHNSKFSYPLEKSIEMLYRPEDVQCLQSYLEVIWEVVNGNQAPIVPFWKSLTASLFMLSHPDSSVRMTSAKILRNLDERNRNCCKLQELDMSIADRTTAVHRKAKFVISKTLAAHYNDNAFFVFSEFSKQFKFLHVDYQRDFVHALLPWLQTIELQLKQKDGTRPTASSYMLLVNLLEITLGYSAPLQHEIQAMWQALATGPHGGNVKLILDFIIQLCLERKDQNLVEVARHIVVFLSETPAGQRLIDALLIQITPRTMTLISDGKQNAGNNVEQNDFPYTAELSSAQPDAGSQTMSLGQLCLILLVDLIVAPQKIPAKSIPTILQVVLVLWDHHTPIVQDQAREMLIHLIHELVISELSKESKVPDHVHFFIDQLQQHNAQVTWTYEDNDGKDSKYELPDSFVYVVSQLVDIFSLVYKDIKRQWGKTSLRWGTTCEGRHLATRSLQIFRCILTPLEQKTANSLIGVLGCTIVDARDECHLYNKEVMRAIRAVLEDIDSSESEIWPQLFWAICACLDSVREAEFAEALKMVEIFLDKFDVEDTTVFKALITAKPHDFKWISGSLSEPIYEGCRSSLHVTKCLSLLDRLIRIPSNELVGDDSRLLFTLLANVPRFANSLRTSNTDPHVVAAAGTLANSASSQGLNELQYLLDLFASNSFMKGIEDFHSEVLAAIRPLLQPFGVQCLLFSMGLLMNGSVWFKREVLKFMRFLSAELDLSNPEIAAYGSDLLTPLLRLLQTDLCKDALPILDRFNSVVGSAPSSHQIQMSLLAARSSRAMRKQYEDIPSLWGIPEESGWSVPMPTERRYKVSLNLQSISKFNPEELDGTSTIATPASDFEFNGDDRISYFPDRTETMTSDEATLAETNMSELVTKLDSLDDFFDDDDASPSSSGKFNTISSRGTVNGNGPRTTFDSFGSSSNQSVFVRSSPRTNLSYRTPPTPREPLIMSPSAFTASPPPPSRPPMPRSRTSPAVNERSSSEQEIVSFREEPLHFSDDDVHLGDFRNGDGQIAAPTSTILSRSRPSVRSALKKLTGVEKHRPLRQTAEAPDVPKVPDVYLQQQPPSSDL